MKNTSKLIGILSALIVVILAVFLVTMFNSHESARVNTSSSPAKTVKKSSSSSSKAVKKDKKTAKSSSSAVSNEENDNQASAVAPKASSQEQAQAGTADGGQVAEAAAGSDKVKSEKNTNNSQSSLDFGALDNGDISSLVGTWTNANGESVTINSDGTIIEKGDFAIIDFAGTVDGEAFSGGEGKGYPLEVGSNSFIPGFEDQLVGLKKGDATDVEVTFPEDYFVKELAGKEAVFQCDVKKVEAKELPELDDDFAQDASEFDTLAEYKEDIKKNLTEKKEKEARAAKENAAVDKAIENAEMEIPDAMVATQTRQMLDDFARRMQSQGLTMDQYMQFTGTTLASLQEQMKPQALKRIQTRLVLEKIAEVENIQPTDEEVEEEFKKMADAYKMEVEKIKELLGDRELEQMKKDMAVQKAVTLVADEAKEA